jgi:hypothetical protein
MQATFRHLGAAALCFMIMTATSLVAGPPGKDDKGSKGKRGQGAPTQTAVHTGTHVDFHFSTGHVHTIREYYAPRYRNLPPGLQKKYARTGQLPPGWEKKMEPLPVVIEREMPRLPAGYRRGVIDGHVVIARGSTIIDVAVLF